MVEYKDSQVLHPQRVLDVTVYASDNKVQKYVDKDCVPILHFQLKLNKSERAVTNVHLQLVYWQSGIELNLIDDEKRVHKMQVIS